MKKLLTWLMVFALCLASLSALAEETPEDRLYTLSAGNLSFSLGDEEPQNVPLTLILMGGAAQDGSFAAGIGVHSDTGALGELTLLGKDRALTAYLGGTANAYTVTCDEAAQLSDELYNTVMLNGEAMGMDAQQQQQTAAALQMLTALLTSEDLTATLESMGISLDMMESLEQMWQMEEMDPETEARLEQELLPLIGVDMETPTYEEEGEILGMTMPLKGYAFSMDGEDILAIYDALAEAVPAYGQMMEIMEGAMNGVTVVTDEADAQPMTMAQMMESLDMVIEGVVWMDETEQYTKVDMQLTETVEEDGQSISVTIPYLMEAAETTEGDAARYQMRVAMDMSQLMVTGVEAEELEGLDESLDGLVEMNLDVTETPQETNLDLQYNLDFAEMTATMTLTGGTQIAEDGTQNFQGQLNAAGNGTEMTMNTSGAYRLGEDGEETLTFAFDAAQDGQQMLELGLDYNGQIVKGEGSYDRGGRVEVDASIAGQPAASLGMDLYYGHQPLTEEMFASLDELPTISLTQLLTDPEAQTAGMTDLQTAMFTALGGVMQIPGVAEMIATETVEAQ